MAAFNPLAIPLAGRQLIEASAGTGKTYSLALLYLRLILERNLEVEQILVVTFTRAATEELRGRIRARLRQALDQLEGRTAEGADPNLADLLHGLPDPEAAGQQLADTLTRMDEAAIHTIHGFCQRVLREQAFEAGTPFGIEFIESEQLLRREISEDFWRRRFYRAPAEEAAWAAATWQNPEGLLCLLQGYLAPPELTFVPAVTAAQVQELHAAAARLWQEVRVAWLRERETVIRLLHENPCLSRDNRKGYGAEPLARAIAGMEKMAAERAMAWLLPPGAELLAASEMACRLKGKKIQPHHPFFAGYDAWYRQHGEFVQAARAQTLAESYHFLRTELDRRKREQGVLSFDDQLRRLAAALAGGEGPPLAQRIRGRFKVALVDEFQDTDPLQYRIFQTLFGGPPEPGLFMIGDPKQSIYSFRGADIFAYIRAQAATPAGAAHTMDTNFRSSPAMVAAVNRLFGRRPHFVFAEILFHPVRPGLAAAAPPLLVAGKAPPPLQVQLLPPFLAAAGKARIAKDRAEEAAAAWAAGEIARLLRLGRSGEALLAAKPLAGADLAVLVRTHHEAELVRRALDRLQIASVYYSQDSVFATAEADHFSRLLAALLEPAAEGPVANALVTDFFGLDGPTLHALRGDPLGWGETLGELAEYQQRWSRAGVMAMFQLVLQRRQMVRRLLAQPGGERKLTNYLHLAELLQEASGHLRTEELLRWFRQQRQEPEPEAASQQLRLESDSDLVTIVTIHKAKGLEYPVVFLPFLWSVRPVRPNHLFAFHGPAGQLHLDLGSGNQDNFHQAERERLAEDLRLLYVAMTRAKCATFFTWGPVSGMEQSALAWLLHPDADGGEGVASDLSPERLRADLAALDQGEGLLRFLSWPEAGQEEHLAAQPRPALTGARQFRAHIDGSWSVSSYSRLAAGPSPEVVPVAAVPDTGAAGTGMTPFAFPRGAAAGTVLHTVLEQLDFRDPHATAPETVAELLRRGGLGPQWAPLVLDWLAEVLATPLLAGTDLRLDQVRQEDRLAELGFYFSLAGLEQEGLNGLLAKYGVAPVALAPGRLHGLMKGYIDLVFRAGGRYYIADYKSNYLGAAAADYRQEGMARAMAEHRYDLQYLIYTVALHRYLRQRLPGYDYDRTIGGAFYLFLRGMRADLGPACGVWHALPPRALVEELDLYCGHGEER